MQGEIAWRTLPRRIPTLRLAPIDEVPFRAGMTVYGVHALPVAWDDIHQSPGDPAPPAEREPARHRGSRSGSRRSRKARAR